jgi:hypothetical protein
MFIVSEDKINYAYKLAEKYSKVYKDWRWGQCLFNAYKVVFPVETEKIRGTNFDCFYDDSKVLDFLKQFSIENKE